MRPGDRGNAYYELSVAAEVKKVEVGEVEVVSVGDDGVAVRPGADVTLRPGYLVEFELPASSVLSPASALVLSSGSGRFSGIDRIVVGKLLGLFVSQRVTAWVANENHEDLAVLAELLASGRVTPVIDRTCTLSDAAEALRYVEKGHISGNSAGRGPPRRRASRFPRPPAI